MADRDSDFKNILVIHFGQLGDVILALPAMRAIRDRFADDHITALTGKVSGEIVALSGFADDVIAVDRVELRDGPKLRSIRKIIALTRDLRRRKVDLVIDLHSLKETNILAWLTGARYRLLADRGNRSYHELFGKFHPSPPPEDRSLHLSKTYMRVLSPMGLDAEVKSVVTVPADEDRKIVHKEIFHKIAAPAVGIFPGAGHASRRWPLDRFARLAEELVKDGYAPVVFLGPEEREMVGPVQRSFPRETVIAPKLTIRKFIAAVAETKIFITNDTGPMHLAALAGAPILLIMDKRAPLTYLPLASVIEVVNDATIDEISVESVHSAAGKLLGIRDE